jgi:hypothetical protein
MRELTAAEIEAVAGGVLTGITFAATQVPSLSLLIPTGVVPGNPIVPGNPVSPVLDKLFSSGAD